MSKVHAIVLSSRNPSKIQQIQGVFAGSGITILGLDDVGIAGEGIEDGTTLGENARKKALFAWELLRDKQWVMAEDTGLFIHALNGAPGIKAARWAGERASSEEIMKFTLNKLKDAKDRSAKFKAVVVVISPLGKEYYFEGVAQGILLETPRTKPQQKMPYSPLFIPDGSRKTWAEMSIDEENSISHRGKAFAQVLNFLLTQK